MPGKTSGQTRRGAEAQGAARRLRVKQVRSGIGRPAVHRRTLTALGLRHHQHVIVVSDTPAIRGMLYQVRHLVEVSPAGDA